MTPEVVMILTWNLDQTKLDKRNKTMSKKFVDDIMSTNCDIIVVFPIFGQFGAILKPDCKRIVSKTYIFNKGNLFSYKNRKQNKKISNTAIKILLWIKVLLWPKNADFLQGNADISKIKRAWVLKRIFS